MKQFLMFLLLGAALCCFADKTLFEENFESYEVGTQMSEQEGWGILGNFTGNTTVVDGISGMDGKCMAMSYREGGNEGDVVVMLPAVDYVPEDPLKEVTKISFTFISASKDDILALHDSRGNPYFYLRCDAETGIMYSTPSGLTFDNLMKDGHTPNTLEITYDFNEKKAVAVKLNGVEKECNIAAGGSCVQPTRLYFYAQLSTMLEDCTAAYFDDVLIKTETRAAGQTLICDSQVLIPLDKDSADFELKNGGSSEITYTATANQEWLEITPAGGTFSSSTTLTLSAKEGYRDTFRRCFMTVDGGSAGVKVVEVMYQGGDVIFREDFDTMEDGNIIGQRGWSVDVGSVVITNAYDCSGKCMFCYAAGGNDACSTYLPEPYYENLIVKVSFDMYWPSSGKGSGDVMLQKESGSNEKFENAVYPDYENAVFVLNNIQNASGRGQAIVDFPGAPMDQWVTVEYTMDLQLNRLLSFGWNGVVTNFSKFTLKNPSCNIFKSWGNAIWDNEGQTYECNLGIDNLQVERIKRGSGPEIIAPAYVDGGTANFFTIELMNGGSGSFEYTAEMLDLDDALTINRPTGKVTDVGSVTVTPDRSKLDDNYYRARVRFDAGEAGCATTIVAFVVGKVYYFSDFEEPFFSLGDITGQDGWQNDWSGNNAYVISTNDTQTLVIETGGGYGGYWHTLEVPRNSVMKFEMDMFVPPAIFEDPDRIGNAIIHLKQNSAHTPSIELRITPDMMDGVPILFGDAIGYDYPFAPAEYTYEWMHVSYVIDYLEGRLWEFTIDNTVEYPEFCYTSDSDVPCTSFYICVATDVNVQVDNVKVSVVPEPAVLGLLGFLALAIWKRR